MRIHATRPRRFRPISAALLVTGALVCVHPVVARCAAAGTAPAPEVTDPWQPTDTVAPAVFAKLLATESSHPAIVYVGFRALYRPGHIPGATLHGPASEPEGLADLRQWAEPLARSSPVVIYCGCCPLDRCPNVRPAFTTLREMGFTNVRVLVLPTSFEKDWVDKGYPVDRR
jgi:thiosulfate/3-mercaptopyruvate sulfurtransferase